MRLTLRTMLAYLDGILEPNDAQDVGKKVEESDFATSLMHRIRDVMRRLRLGAPSLTDRGPRLDPNTVAEYLDNTLPVEQVTDFEKVCLDSDVHLAEVASCHQILTLVLGEPAEVDPASRQRMYQLKDAPAEAKPAAPPVQARPVTAASTTPPPLHVAALDDESETRKHRPKPTVPEYLRERPKRSHLFPAIALAVVVVCVVVVTLKMFGQLEDNTPLGNFLVSLGLRSAPTDVAGGPAAPRAEKGAARSRKEAPPAEDVDKKATDEATTEAPKEATKEPADQAMKSPANEPAANTTAPPPPPVNATEAPPPGPAAPRHRRASRPRQASNRPPKQTSARKRRWARKRRRKRPKSLPCSLRNR